MKLEELVLLQVDRLQRAIREFVEEKNWKYRVMRLKEIKIYERELTATIERLDNLVENDFRKQTGDKAVRLWWRIWKPRGEKKPPQSQAEP